MRSGQRFPYLALDPEETRSINAAYHQRIHKDQSNLIPLDPEAFVQTALTLLASDRYLQKGMALMALTGRRPAEIFFSAKFSLPRKKLHFRARSLWTNPGNRATSGAPTAPACHKFKPKNQTDDIFVALVPRP
jgi:hypothetical protein